MLRVCQDLTLKERKDGQGRKSGILKREMGRLETDLFNFSKAVLESP